MKKVINTFLIIGFVAFLAASCSPTTGKVKPADTPAAQQPGGGSSSGTPSTPSTPSYTTVNSEDGIYSVTIRNDGLLLKANFNQPWQHFSFMVRDVTNSEWHEIIETNPKVSKSGNSGSCSVLFPFTAKDRKYEIHYIHMGNAEDEWADWTECKAKANTVTVTAIGGSGRLDVTCKSAQYWSPRRGLFLEDLDIVEPELANASKSLKVRAEKCYSENGFARWREERTYETSTIAPTIWFPKDENNDFTKYVKGSDKLFFCVQYKIVYNNVEFMQRFYGNWADWDNQNNCEIADSNWFVDYGCLDQTAPKLPRIEINSEDADNEWVALPIAAHVKEQARAWTNEYDDYPDPYYKDCTISTFSDGGTAELDIAAGQVKVRGNWTTSYAKKSLRIKFKEAHSMLGLHKGGSYKNWVLLAGYKDASLLRDAIGMKLYAEMFGGDQGYYVSDCKLVDLFINGVYWGVYLLAEQLEIQEAKTGDTTNPARINARETPKGDKEKMTGYLIEFDSYSSYEAPEEHFYIDYTLGNSENKLYDYENGNENRELKDIQSGYTIKSDIRDIGQHDFIENYMNKVWEICYKAAYKNEYLTFNNDYTELVGFTAFDENDTADEKCEKCISAIIDVNSLASMYIFNELICDPDLYLTSFFMDVDFGTNGDKRLRFEAPWDFDSTMGNKSFAISDTTGETVGGKQPQYMCEIDDMFAGACQTDVNCFDARIHGNPWMVIFINCGWFQKLVFDIWDNLDPTTTVANIEGFYNDMQTDYRAHLEFNRARWGYPESDELCNASRVAAKTSQQASAEYLKDWLWDRWFAVAAIIQGWDPN